MEQMNDTRHSHGSCLRSRRPKNWAIAPAHPVVPAYDPVDFRQIIVQPQIVGQPIDDLLLGQGMAIELDAQERLANLQDVAVDDAVVPFVLAPPPEGLAALQCVGEIEWLLDGDQHKVELLGLPDRPHPPDPSPG